MLFQRQIILLALCLAPVLAQDAIDDDTTVTFNPRPENISLLRPTPPQYKFYVKTPKGSGKKHADLDQRYRAQMGTQKSSGSTDGDKGAEARQKSYEQRKGEAKANRNID